MDGSSNRPRAWSHKSDKSQGSKKETLVESPADKKRRDSLWKGTGSKANPNSAINEAQPGGTLPSSLPKLYSHPLSSWLQLQSPSSKQKLISIQFALFKRPSPSSLSAASSTRTPKATPLVGTPCRSILCQSYANVSTTDEPDLSNPTRPRWERPLDTIRSFERAIDGGYKRRSISRSGTSLFYLCKSLDR